VLAQVPAISVSSVLALGSKIGSTTDQFIAPEDEKRRCGRNGEKTHGNPIASAYQSGVKKPSRMERVTGRWVQPEDREMERAPLRKIVLIDDNCILLSRLRKLLERNSDFVVVTACRCAEGAMAAVQLHQPAVVILDVRLPDRDGVELIRNIIAVSGAKVIVFTAVLPKEEIVRVLQSGAEAIVYKDQPWSVLVSYVRRVLTPREGVKAETGDCISDLTPREREVARCVVAGARNKEIARQLGISEGTVKFHLFRAYQKLRVANRVGLMLALGRMTRVIITFVGLTEVW
jgi:DNA-binding NarL/FixJ family response regulator